VHFSPRFKNCLLAKILSEGSHVSRSRVLACVFRTFYETSFSSFERVSPPPLPPRLPPPPPPAPPPPLSYGVETPLITSASHLSTKPLFFPVSCVVRLPLVFLFFAFFFRFVGYYVLLDSSASSFAALPTVVSLSPALHFSPRPFCRTRQFERLRFSFSDLLLQLNTRIPPPRPCRTSCPSPPPPNFP